MAITDSFDRVQENITINKEELESLLMKDVKAVPNTKAMDEAKPEEEKAKTLQDKKLDQIADALQQIIGEKIGKEVKEVSSLIEKASKAANEFYEKQRVKPDKTVGLITSLGKLIEDKLSANNTQLSNVLNSATMALSIGINKLLGTSEFGFQNITSKLANIGEILNKAEREPIKSVEKPIKTEIIPRPSVLDTEDLTKTLGSMFQMMQKTPEVTNKIDTLQNPTKIVQSIMDESLGKKEERVESRMEPKVVYVPENKSINTTTEKLVRENHGPGAPPNEIVSQTHSIQSVEKDIGELTRAGMSSGSIFVHDEGTHQLLVQLIELLGAKGKKKSARIKAIEPNIEAPTPLETVLENFIQTNKLVAATDVSKQITPTELSKEIAIILEKFEVTTADVSKQIETISEKFKFQKDNTTKAIIYASDVAATDVSKQVTPSELSKEIAAYSEANFAGPISNMTLGPTGVVPAETKADISSVIKDGRLLVSDEATHLLLQLVFRNFRSMLDPVGEKNRKIWTEIDKILESRELTHGESKEQTDKVLKSASQSSTTTSEILQKIETHYYPPEKVTNFTSPAAKMPDMMGPTHPSDFIRMIDEMREERVGRHKTESGRPSAQFMQDAEDNFNKVLNDIVSKSGVITSEELYKKLFEYFHTNEAINPPKEPIPPEVKEPTGPMTLFGKEICECFSREIDRLIEAITGIGQFGVARERPGISKKNINTTLQGAGVEQTLSKDISDRLAKMLEGTSKTAKKKTISKNIEGALQGAGIEENLSKGISDELAKMFKGGGGKKGKKFKGFGDYSSYGGYAASRGPRAEKPEKKKGAIEKLLSYIDADVGGATGRPFNELRLRDVFSIRQVANRVGEALTSEKPAHELLRSSNIGVIAGGLARMIPVIGQTVGNFVENLFTFLKIPVLKEFDYFQDLRQTAFETAGINTGFRGEGGAPGQVAGTAAQVNEGIAAQQTSLTGGQNLQIRGVEGLNESLKSYIVGLDHVLMTNEAINTIQNVQIRNIRRGIRDVGTLNRVTIAGLNTARLLGSNADETANLFADMHQNLQLSSIEIGQMGRGFREIARQTGVTGDNLIRIVQSAQQYMKNLQLSGTFTPAAGQNITQLLATASTTGVTEGVQKIVQELSGNFLAPGGDESTRNLLIASTQGNQQLLQQLITGTLLQNRQGLRMLGQGMEQFFNAITGLRPGQTIEDMSPIARAAADALTRTNFGKGLNELRLTIDTFREGTRSFAERLDAFNQMAPGPGLTQNQIDERRQSLVYTQTMEYLTQFSRSLQGVSAGADGVTTALQRFNRTTSVASGDFRNDLRALQIGVGEAGANQETIAALLGQAITNLNQRLVAVGQPNLVIAPTRVPAAIGDATKINQLLSDIVAADQVAAAEQKAMQDPISRIEKIIREINAKISEMIKAFLTGFAGFSKYLFDEIKTSPWIQAFQSGDIAKGWDGLEKGIDNFGNTAANWRKEINSMDFTPFQKQLLTIATVVVEAFVLMIKAVKNIVKWLIEVFTKYIIPAAEMVWGVAKTIAGWFVGEGNEVKVAVGLLAGGFFLLLTPILSLIPLFIGLAKLIPGIITVFAKLIPGIVELGTLLPSLIAGGTLATLSGVGQVLGRVVLGLGQAAASIVVVTNAIQAVANNDRGGSGVMNTVYNAAFGATTGNGRLPFVDNFLPEQFRSRPGELYRTGRAESSLGRVGESLWTDPVQSAQAGGIGDLFNAAARGAVIGSVIPGVGPALGAFIASVFQAGKVLDALVVSIDDLNTAQRRSIRLEREWIAARTASLGRTAEVAQRETVANLPNAMEEMRSAQIALQRERADLAQLGTFRNGQFTPAPDVTRRQIDRTGFDPLSPFRRATRPETDAELAIRASHLQAMIQNAEANIQGIQGGVRESLLGQVRPNLLADTTLGPQLRQIVNTFAAAQNDVERGAASRNFARATGEIAPGGNAFIPGTNARNLSELREILTGPQAGGINFNQIAASQAQTTVLRQTLSNALTDMNLTQQQQEQTLNNLMRSIGQYNPETIRTNAENNIAQAMTQYFNENPGGRTAAGNNALIQDVIGAINRGTVTTLAGAQTEYLRLAQAQAQAQGATGNINASNLLINQNTALGTTLRNSINNLIGAVSGTAGRTVLTGAAAQTLNEEQLRTFTQNLQRPEFTTDLRSYSTIGQPGNAQLASLTAILANRPEYRGIRVPTAQGEQDLARVVAERVAQTITTTPGAATQGYEALLPQINQNLQPLEQIQIYSRQMRDAFRTGTGLSGLQTSFTSALAQLPTALGAQPADQTVIARLLSTLSTAFSGPGNMVQTNGRIARLMGELTTGDQKRLTLEQQLLSTWQEFVSADPARRAELLQEMAAIQKALEQARTMTRLEGVIRGALTGGNRNQQLPESIQQIMNSGVLTGTGLEQSRQVVSMFSAARTPEQHLAFVRQLTSDANIAAAPVVGTPEQSSRGDLALMRNITNLRTTFERRVAGNEFLQPRQDRMVEIVQRLNAPDITVPEAVTLRREFARLAEETAALMQVIGQSVGSVEDTIAALIAARHGMITGLTAEERIRSEGNLQQLLSQFLRRQGATPQNSITPLLTAIGQRDNDIMASIQGPGVDINGTNYGPQNIMQLEQRRNVFGVPTETTPDFRTRISTETVNAQSRLMQEYQSLFQTAQRGGVAGNNARLRIADILQAYQSLEQAHSVATFQASVGQLPANAAEPGVAGAMRSALEPFNRRGPTGAFAINPQQVSDIVTTTFRRQFGETVPEIAALPTLAQRQAYVTTPGVNGQPGITAFQEVATLQQRLRALSAARGNWTDTDAVEFYNSQRRLASLLNALAGPADGAAEALDRFRAMANLAANTPPQIRNALQAELNAEIVRLVQPRVNPAEDANRGVQLLLNNLPRNELLNTDISRQLMAAPPDQLNRQYETQQAALLAAFTQARAAGNQPQQVLNIVRNMASLEASFREATNQARLGGLLNENRNIANLTPERRAALPGEITAAQTALYSTPATAPLQTGIEDIIRGTARGPAGVQGYLGTTGDLGSNFRTFLTNRLTTALNAPGVTTTDQASRVFEDVLRTSARDYADTHVQDWISRRFDLANVPNGQALSTNIIQALRGPNVNAGNAMETINNLLQNNTSLTPEQRTAAMNEVQGSRQIVNSLFGPAPQTLQLTQRQLDTIRGQLTDRGFLNTTVNDFLRTRTTPQQRIETGIQTFNRTLTPADLQEPGSVYQQLATTANPLERRFNMERMEADLRTQLTGLAPNMLPSGGFQNPQDQRTWNDATRNLAMIARVRQTIRTDPLDEAAYKLYEAGRLQMTAAEHLLLVGASAQQLRQALAEPGGVTSGVIRQLPTTPAALQQNITNPENTYRQTLLAAAPDQVGATTNNLMGGLQRELTASRNDPQRMFDVLQRMGTLQMTAGTIQQQRNVVNANAMPQGTPEEIQARQAAINTANSQLTQAFSPINVVKVLGDLMNNLEPLNEQQITNSNIYRDLLAAQPIDRERILTSFLSTQAGAYTGALTERNWRGASEAVNQSRIGRAAGQLLSNIRDINDPNFVGPLQVVPGTNFALPQQVPNMAVPPPPPPPPMADTARLGIPGRGMFNIPAIWNAVPPMPLPEATRLPGTFPTFMPEEVPSKAMRLPEEAPMPALLEPMSILDRLNLLPKDRTLPTMPTRGDWISTFDSVNNSRMNQITSGLTNNIPTEAPKPIRPAGIFERLNILPDEDRINPVNPVKPEIQPRLPIGNYEDEIIKRRFLDNMEEAKTAERSDEISGHTGELVENSEVTNNLLQKAIDIFTEIKRLLSPSKKTRGGNPTTQPDMDSFDVFSGDTLLDNVRYSSQFANNPALDIRVED